MIYGTGLSLRGTVTRTTRKVATKGLLRLCSRRREWVRQFARRTHSLGIARLCVSWPETPIVLLHFAPSWRTESNDRKRTNAVFVSCTELGGRNSIPELVMLVIAVGFAKAAEMLLATPEAQ